MTRLILIASTLLAGACASSTSTPSPGKADAGLVKGSPEDVCSGTPKNCLPMPEEVYAECVREMASRAGSVCYPKLVALKDCFITMAECDEAGEVIENENGNADCNYENGELEACCQANTDDASCKF
jgi:hypothetical protein